MRKFLFNLFTLAFILVFTLFSLFLPLSVLANSNNQITPKISSIYGNDRYETAAKIARNGWPGTSEYAIISAGMSENLIDAMTVGPLAAQLNAPILLTEGNTLNKYTIAEINRLKAQKVYITSGLGVIKQNVIDSIKALPTVTEVKTLGGYDASETSVNIAKEMSNIGCQFNKVIITGGDGSDALSIAPIAGTQCIPILYTNGDNLSESVKTYFNDIQSSVSKTYIVGGAAVIGDSAISELPGEIERYSGPTKYDTNIEILKQFTGVLNHKTTYVANGETLVDAMTSIPLAVKTNSAILLTGKGLPKVSKDYALSNLSQNYIGLGGPSVMSKSILTELSSDGTSSATTPSTEGEDSSAPVNAPNYPKLGLVTSTHAQVLIRINKPGTAYYVILPNIQESVPNATQVKAGTDGSNNQLSSNRKGKIKMLANQEENISISGLSPNGHYEIYIVCEENGLNLQLSPVNLSILTAPPPPVIFGPVSTVNHNLMGSSVPGATITLSKNDIVWKTLTASSDGIWSVDKITLSKGDSISVTAQLPGSFVTDPATLKIKQTNILVPFVTPAPTITGTVKADDTSISGTIVGGAKIVVKINKDFQPVNVVGGTWIVNNLTLNVGDRISITAQLDGLSESKETTATVTAKYPRTDNITSNSARISLQNNEADKAYYVVWPGEPFRTPWVDEIISGESEENTPLAADCKGSVLLEGHKVTSFIISDLLPVSTYTIFITYSTKNRLDKVVLTTKQAKTAKPVISGDIIAGNDSKYVNDISGTASANAEIILKVNGSPRPAVYADSSGHWTVPYLTLFVGYDISVTAQSRGETVSDATTKKVLAAVDAQTPAPVIYGPVEAGTNVFIWGSSIAGSSIVIKNSTTNVVLARIRTGTDGTWMARKLTLVKGSKITVTAQLPGEAISDEAIAVVE